MSYQDVGSPNLKKKRKGKKKELQITALKKKKNIALAEACHGALTSYLLFDTALLLAV